MTDAPPIITNEDAAIDSAFFGSHAGRTCYARAHHSGWVLVVRQIVAQREPPVMLRVWGRLDRVPDNDANCPALWERCAHARRRSIPRCKSPLSSEVPMSTGTPTRRAAAMEG
jgi:hypothetical protein